VIIIVLLWKAKQMNKLESAQETIQKELQSQHSVLEGIINSTEELIFSLDRDYRYTSFNQNHFGVMKAIYNVDIQLGGSLLDYMTVDEDRQKAKNNIDRALGGEQFSEEAFSGEESLSRFYFVVSHSPIRDQKNQIIGVSVFTRNITDRKRIEEKLQRSEEQYRALFNNAEVGMYRSRLDSSAILAVNQKLANIHETSIEELLSNTAHMRWAHQEERDKMIQALKERGSLVDYELDIITKNGKIKTCLASMKAFHDEGYLEGSLIDITERKELERDLKEFTYVVRTIYRNLSE
jgi:PAS domain S-box-containing protein